MFPYTFKSGSEALASTHMIVSLDHIANISRTAGKKKLEWRFESVQLTSVAVFFIPYMIPQWYECSYK